MAYKALWVQFPIIPLTLSTPLPFTYEAPATLDPLLVLKNATHFPTFHWLHSGGAGEPTWLSHHLKVCVSAALSQGGLYIPSS